jgi:hypothetical protein
MKTNDLMRHSAARVGLVTAFILSIPLVAMLFTDDVDWGVGDFVIMGALIFAAGFTIDTVARKASGVFRAVLIIGILAASLLIWAELAVGLIEQLFDKWQGYSG